MKKKLTRLAFVRHGNTTAPDDDDAARTLTPQGRLQASYIGDVLRHRINHFDAAVSSSALRCVQTMEHVLKPFPGAPFSTIPEMYPVGPGLEWMDRMFSRLKYSPLTTYEQQYGITGEFGQFREWSSDSLVVVGDYFKNHVPTDDQVFNGLVVGHAVSTPLMVAQLIGWMMDMSQSDYDPVVVFAKLYTLNMGEADCLLVEITTDENDAILEVTLEHLENQNSARPVPPVLDDEADTVHDLPISATK